MAEPHDLAERPGGAGLPASFPAVPPEAAAPAEQSYRSLSLLALIGFGIAAVYATFMVLLGLVAFRSGRPLELGTWAWLVPFVAAVTCMVAWLRIYRSEDTLAGGALARWGLLLAAFVGLSSGAYSLAVNLALRQQAEQAAREWLDLLRQGRLDKAMLRMLPPLQRANISEDDPDLWGKIVLALGSAEDVSAEALRNNMAQFELVRLVTQGGDQTTFEFRGVKGREITRDGFELRLSVHIETPELSAETVVTVQGTQAPNGEFAGRQWSIVKQKTGVDQEAGGVRLTPFGEKIQQLTAKAFAFLGNWHQKLMNDKVEAFLLTLPEDQRPTRLQALRRALRVGTLAGAAAVAAPDLQALAAYHRFVVGLGKDGGWVEIPKDLTADDSLHKEVEAMVRNLFNEQADGPPPGFESQQRRPSWTRKGDKIQFAIGIQLTRKPMFTADVLVTMEGDARILKEDVPPRWRLAGFKVVSAQKRTGPSQTRNRRR